MRRTFGEIDRLLSAEGVVSRRVHPELDGTLRYLAGKGDLTRVLPGVYASAATAPTARVRIAALMAYDPDAVLTEAAAASVSFWPDINVGTVTCAVRHRRQPQPGIVFTRPVRVDGASYYPDARFFGRTRLLIEVDGREFHSDPDVFESDRWRQNLLILDGWCVLRFTWQMLEERPDEVVAIIRRALAMFSAA